MTTLKNVIKAGYLTAFPKFTTKQFRKFPPNSKATVAGHIHTTRGNKKRTTTTPTVANITIIEPDSIPSPNLIEEEPEDQESRISNQCSSTSHHSIFELDLNKEPITIINDKIKRGNPQY